MNDRLPELLARRLREAPMRPAVGTRFEPNPLVGRCYDRFPTDARQAAVLLMLYPHEGRWHVPLTLRPSTLPDHAGQVSLPGGAIEPGESSAVAAIREFREELGADHAPVELLGRLAPVYVQVSNFRVEPWVGRTDTRPPFEPSSDEVAELLEVPLTHLIDPANFGAHRRKHRGQPYTAPHFAWQSHRVWGATCMILGQLVLILEGLGEDV